MVKYEFAAVDDAAVTVSVYVFPAPTIRIMVPDKAPLTKEIKTDTMMHFKAVYSVDIYQAHKHKAYMQPSFEGQC